MRRGLLCRFHAGSFLAPPLPQPAAPSELFLGSRAIPTSTPFVLGTIYNAVLPLCGSMRSTFFKKMIWTGAVFWRTLSCRVKRVIFNQKIRLVNTPQSKRYDISNLLSETSFCQTWQARNRAAGRTCLLKITPTGDATDVAVARGLLKQSYVNQQRLRSSRIITAIDRFSESGRLLVEYPFLNPERWSPLTDEMLARDFVSLVSAMCVLTDLLHLHKLVHCDLKLSNFMVRVGGDMSDVAMIDLDFLSQDGTRPQARVFGTEHHIAPEILANDRITLQSDNYSLGVSLGDFLERHPDLEGGLRRTASALVEMLLHQDYAQRPRFMISALTGSGLIDDRSARLLDRRLFGLWMMSLFRHESGWHLNSVEALGSLIREQAQILGEQDDLIREYVDSFLRDRRTTFRNWCAVLKDVPLERLEEFWSLEPDDTHLLTLYGGDSGAEMADVMNDVRRYREEGRFEKAYIVLRSAAERVGNVISGDMGRAVQEGLSDLAFGLSRYKDAERHFVALLDLQEPGSRVRGRTIETYLKVLVQLRRFDDIQNLLPRFLDEFKADREFVQRFRRVEGWVHRTQGRPAEAIPIFRQIVDEARRLALDDLELLALYNLGTTLGDQGEFTQAEAVNEECLDLIEHKALDDVAVPVLSGVSFLFFEMGEYRRSLKVALEAARLSDRPERRTWFGGACFGVISASVRLGQFANARKWLKRYQQSRVRSGGQFAILAQFNNTAFISRYEGNISGAVECWQRICELSESTQNTVFLGAAHFNLAEIAAMRGDADMSATHLRAAHDSFKPAGRTARLTEVEAVAWLRGRYCLDQPDLPELRRIARALTGCKHRYYATVCVFYAIVNADPEELPEIVELGRPLRKTWDQSGPPLFEATRLLHDYLEENLFDEPIPVEIWKQVFSILSDANFYFEAMLVGLRIAQIYNEQTKVSPCRKFLQQALVLAEALPNPRYIQQIGEQLLTQSRSSDFDSRLVESFHGVSLVLRNIDNYREALRELVQFAVDQTGAERGVLLLRHKETGKLQVAASLNCDDQSLDDISDFSTSIPMLSFSREEAVLISDAGVDVRTREYVSIIRHNIKSVTCVPLMDGDIAVGVLYLDHHRIPALFDDSDITYIRAIANFIGSVLTTVKDYRSLFLSNRQAMQDLADLGQGPQFLTQDATIRRILQKIPQIAASSTSVLVTGESGTGKDLLCRMIHEYSTRSGEPFETLNCSAIADSLIEAELFGVAHGVATGVTEREGRFVAANGGTMFLDEIGDMPLKIQAKVLHVIEHGDIQRVGTSQTRKVDIRFISATNRDLDSMRKEGTFRTDLYHRICTISINIPPLRERLGDVALLRDHFLTVFSKGKKAPRFTPNALRVLDAYRWEGNVRELRNFIEGCCILNAGQTVHASMLPDYMQIQAVSSSRARKIGEYAEKERMIKALDENDWVVSRSAKSIGMKVTTFRRKMIKYSIRRPR